MCDVDFGLSALMLSTNEDNANSRLDLRRLTSIVGSPHYVAPEILQDGSGYDGTKADMWSMGTIKS